MKKALYITVIAFCISLCANAQDIVNLRMDRQQMGLRGNVASMDEDILLRKDYFREDWPERKWFVKDLRSVLREDNGRIVTFNPAGRMLTITYTHQGKQGKTTRCTYAANGLLASFVGEGYKVEARYNGNNADINVFAETKDYNPSVDLAKADLNTTPYTNSYPFDLKCRQELTDDGLVLTSSYYYVDSLPAKVCEYKYNNNNMLVSEKVTDYSSGEKSVSTVKYTYDNRGFLTKKTVHGKAADETYTYENNEQGDCTKMTIERAYGTVVYTFEYVYDEQQNWTVRLQFQDGVFDNAALRTLTYHKDVKPAAAKPEKKAKSTAKDKKSEKASKPVESKAKKKDSTAADKQAAKEAKARQKEEMNAQKARAKEAEKNMTKEERKAAEAERKAVEKAEKERIAAENKAAKEKAAAEKKALKERQAAEKRAEKERQAAEKQAEKERKAAEKAAKKSK